MTTATPARHPRPLKHFRVDRAVAGVPAELYELVMQGATHNQGDLLIAAPTKKAALDRLAELNRRPPASDVRLAHGNDLDALVAAGLLDRDGDVIAYRNQVDSKLVGLARRGEPARVVGAWRWDRAEYKIVFEAATALESMLLVGRKCSSAIIVASQDKTS